jgi:hypothetical protein
MVLQSYFSHLYHTFYLQHKFRCSKRQDSKLTAAHFETRSKHISASTDVTVTIIFNATKSNTQITVKVKQSRYRPGVAQRVPGS